MERASNIGNAKKQWFYWQMSSDKHTTNGKEVKSRHKNICLYIMFRYWGWGDGLPYFQRKEKAQLKRCRSLFCDVIDVDTEAHSFDFVSDTSNSQNASQQEQWKRPHFSAAIWSDWNSVLKLLVFANRCSSCAQISRRLPIPASIIHMLIFFCDIWTSHCAKCTLRPEFCL